MERMSTSPFCMARICDSLSKYVYSTTLSSLGVPFQYDVFGTSVVWSS